MAIRNYQVKTLSKFTGGIDYDSNPFTVSEDCLIALQDMIPSLVSGEQDVGSLSSRSGYQKHNTVQITEAGTQKPVNGLASLVVGGTEYFLAQIGTKFYQNNPEATWTDITGAVVITDTQNNLTSFAVQNNILYAANRQRDQIWQWALSGNATAVTDPPAGKPQALISFNRRIWALGNSATPMIVDYSDLDAITFTGGNNLNFDEGQGTAVVAGVPYGVGNALFFKQKSVHMVEATGTVPAFNRYLFSDGIGCVSHQSIVTLPGGAVMWWDNDDVYIISGNQIKSATVHPSTGQPRLRNFFRNNVNKTRLQYVVGVYYPALDIVRWFYTTTGGTSNNAHIDYHVKTQSWWPGTLRGNAICVRLYTGETRLYSGDINGFAYRQDFGGNDDGAAITSQARLPWQAFEGLLLRKKLGWFFAAVDVAGNYSILADFYFNQSQTADITNQSLSQQALTGAQFDVAQWDVDTFPTETALFEASCKVNRLFKTVSVLLHHTGVDQQFNIHAGSYLYRDLEINRLVGT